MIKGDNRFSTLNKQDRTYFKVKLYLVFQKFKKKTIRKTDTQTREKDQTFWASYLSDETKKRFLVEK